MKMCWLWQAHCTHTLSHSMFACTLEHYHTQVEAVDEEETEKPKKKKKKKAAAAEEPAAEEEPKKKKKKKAKADE